MAGVFRAWARCGVPGASLAEDEPFSEGEVQQRTDSDGDGDSHQDLFHVEASDEEPHQSGIPQNGDCAVAEVEAQQAQALAGSAWAVFAGVPLMPRGPGR